MSYGLIGMGQKQMQDSLTGMGQVSQMEQERNQANDTLKAQADAAHKAQMGTMASSGAMMGFMAGGPVGAAVGLVGGALLGSLF